MERTFINTVGIIMLLLLLLLTGTGCEAMKYISADSLNEQELLQAEEAAKLLNVNGASLMEASDFPVDVSLCRVNDKTPRVYSSNKTGLYYLFYAFDDYQEADSARYQILAGDDDPEMFWNSIFTYTLAGKNLCIYLWYPELGIQSEGCRTMEEEEFRFIEKEILLFKEILQNKAFNKKTVVLTGRGDSWEVVMPVEYIYNVRQAKEGAGDFFFDSRGQTYLKYIGDERKLPEVYEIQWKKPHGVTTMSTDEGSLLGEKELYGFRKVSTNAPGFHPEQGDEITVTINWGRGQSEEIVCAIKKEIPQ
ncbi:MAG: hypothetical protein PHC91_06135 [Eubacteriales bacterium]|nr:hypothetical protein [Eubacteriales bacterium]